VAHTGQSKEKSSYKVGAMKKLYSFLFLISFCTYAQDSITVIGIGKFGLCAALCFEAAGYSVTGFDINQAYVESIKNKSFSSLEPGVNELLKKSTNFHATTSFDNALKAADLIYIMVDTPTKPGEDAYDHSKINTVLSEINKRKVFFKNIVIASTVMPGYIQNTALNLIRDCVHTTISYNPMFIAQGDIIRRIRYPDLILIGEGSQAAGDLIEKLHTRICHNVPAIHRMNIQSAEITKLAVNCFITTKIAYANMIGDIADNTIGADKEAILQAVGSDSRIGSAYLKSGYGFGGPCFPRDNRALGAHAKNVGVDAIIPSATDAANKKHAEFMADRFLKEEQDMYTFSSVTYKENCAVPIIEESQKLAVAERIAHEGKKVCIIDTPPVIAEVQKKFGDLFEYQEHS
jgi:nucleotide sugar dehydrogenase